ncbi:MAG TPA: hypothetical protein VFT59_05455 [Candidatus Saccharimonadales bacterium]|nr:hypothetical protein [Candidatus Saccharimonadales bacterium]
MDVTTMHSITSLANKLRGDFPAFSFIQSDEFRWSPLEKTVYFKPDPAEPESLLHELAHALLSHEDFTRDIQLIEMERDAWESAKKQLAPHYNVEITDDHIQDALDTYRSWLHARSTCPACSATGVQSRKYHYRCLVCSTQWKVNDARLCALRRYVPNK